MTWGGGGGGADRVVGGGGGEGGVWKPQRTLKSIIQWTS